MNLPHFRQAAVMPPDLLSYHQLSVRRLSALSSSPKDSAICAEVAELVSPLQLNLPDPPRTHSTR